MFHYFTLAVLSVVLFSAIRRYAALRRNIALAEASGLPYIVQPFSPIPNFTWQILQQFVWPVLLKFEWARKSSRIKSLHMEQSWVFPHEINDDVGEMYLVVGPYSFYANIANAEAIAQITTRKGDFPKPIEDYKSVTMYGKNLVASEGDDFRRHKKVVAPVFSEKSNALVFAESVRQAQGLINWWARQEGNNLNDLKVPDTAVDVAKLALHVICGAGFGVPQVWPDEDRAILGNKIVPGFNTQELYNGHQLYFKDSLDETTSGFVWFALLPTKYMAKSPFKVHKELYRGFLELRQYFDELFEYHKKKLELGEEEKGTMDLLGPLIKASELAAAMHRDNPKQKGVLQSGALTKDETIGNAFVLLFAGHETAAGTMHFSNLLLAMNRPAQKHLQADIDRIVGTRPPSTWSYATDMKNLYNSMIGAIQNEELRLIPTVVNIHKISRTAQTITVEGKPITFPAKTYFHLNVVATQRRPEYYPHSPSKLTGKPNDLDDFVPERWILHKEPEAHSSEKKETEAADGLTSVSYESDDSILFKPAKGAFIAFSEGARSCPGRRFAQVEITAVLAVIFQSYSVELDVRQWASDDEVRRMGYAERKAVYDKARARAMKLIREAYTIVTLKMRGKNVPVRFVKRGEEMFADC